MTRSPNEAVKQSPHEAFSLDLSIAPDGAIGRISANINRRGKRAFGVLKTANEYVGVVIGHEFEVWERQKRAIHARGRIVPRHRGSRLEARFVVSGWTRSLLALFFLLYLLVALGIATQPPDTAVSPGEIAVTIAGAGVLVVLFAAGARGQRADLRSFLERCFAGVERL